MDGRMDSIWSQCRQIQFYLCQHVMQNSKLVLCIEVKPVLIHFHRSQVIEKCMKHILLSVKSCLVCLFVCFWQRWYEGDEKQDPVIWQNTFLEVAQYSHIINAVEGTYYNYFYFVLSISLEAECPKYSHFGTGPKRELSCRV